MIMRFISGPCSQMSEILSFLNWDRNMQVCCILTLRDEGMFMRYVQIKEKGTTASVIMHGYMVYVPRRMELRSNAKIARQEITQN